jgi:hypothetical protein
LRRHRFFLAISLWIRNRAQAMVRSDDVQTSMVLKPQNCLELEKSAAMRQL